MNSREKILAAVKRNQPETEQPPGLQQLTAIHFENAAEQFRSVLEAIGGSVVNIRSMNEITAYVRQHFKAGHHLATTIEGMDGLELIAAETDPHTFETVELAVVNGLFAVAENGAVWLTEKEMKVRVLPFICQHLAVVIPADQILPHMHDAYERIANANYGFGVFIAGPSKTADIEQSLVLGAHGPASMTVFVLQR